MGRSESALYAALAVCAGCRFGPEQQVLRPDPPEPDGSRSSATRASEVSAAAGNTSSAPTAFSNKTASTASAPVMMRMPAAAGSGSAAPPSSEPAAGAPATVSRAGTAATDAGTNAAAGSGGSPAAALVAKDPSCDLNGIWIGKQVGVGVALEQPQFVNTWSYFEIEQSGTEFKVKKHIDCGLEVRGTVTVTLSRATLSGTVLHNMQIGRTGRFELVDGKCVFDIARFWSVRGADEARFIPNPARDAMISVAELSTTKPMPTPSMPDGAFDLEGDGEMGAAAQVTGIVSGTRNSVSRDWNHWFSAPGHEVTPSMDFSDIEVRAESESEEIVMAPTTGLLSSLPEPTSSFEPIMRLRHLGRSLDDARAQPIVHGDPIDTCYAIQDAMPPEMLMQ